MPSRPLSEAKGPGVAVCYFFSKTGNQSGEASTRFTFGRDFQNIEAEVLGAIELDKTHPRQHICNPPRLTSFSEMTHTCPFR